MGASRCIAALLLCAIFGCSPATSHQGGSGDAGGDGTAVGDLADGGQGNGEMPLDLVETSDAEQEDVSSAPMFGECIASWPRSVASPLSSLAVQPRVLWETAALNAPMSAVVTTTLAGVSVTVWATLLIIDEAGTIRGRFDGTAGVLSGPVADSSGAIYVADSAFVYGLDSTGKELWRTRLSPPITTLEFATPSPMVLSDSGLLYLSALDGQLWVIDRRNGSVVSSHFVGLTEAGTPRRIEMGVPDVLFAERLVASGGARMPGIGLFSISSESWRGELVDSDGWLPSQVLGGYEIGIVAWGVTDSGSASTRVTVFDPCGAVKWRVSGEHAIPLAVSFGDELIVGDVDSIGTIRGLRRLTSDGHELSGPVSTDLVVATTVGADGTFYDVGCTKDTATLEARDQSLTLMWSVPLGAGQCPHGMTLGPGGVLFIARAGSGATPNSVIAVQTTSPGPAPVSWSRYGRDSNSTFWLGP